MAVIFSHALEIDHAKLPLHEWRVEQEEQPFINFLDSFFDYDPEREIKFNLFCIKNAFKTMQFIDLS